MMKRKMQLHKNSLLVFITSASILIVALSVAYYFIYYLPKKEEQQRTDRIDREEHLNKCLEDAGKSKKEVWNSVCEIEGKEEDCRLSTFRFDKINERFDMAKEECFKIYP